MVLKNNSNSNRGSKGRDCSACVQHSALCSALGIVFITRLYVHRSECVHHSGRATFQAAVAVQPVAIPQAVIPIRAYTRSVHMILIHQFLSCGILFRSVNIC